MGAVIAGVATEKPEARNVEREVSVFARQKHDVVYPEQ
jgi:hypothetical protein